MVRSGSQNAWGALSSKTTTPRCLSVTVYSSFELFIGLLHEPLFDFFSHADEQGLYFIRTAQAFKFKPYL